MTKKINHCEENVVEELYPIEDMQRNYQREQLYIKLQKEEAAYDTLRMLKVQQDFEDLEF